MSAFITPLSDIRNNGIRLVHSCDSTAPDAARAGAAQLRLVERAEADSRESRDSILGELNKVLCSDTFIHAKGLSRFLRFVVEQSVAGHESELKEYVIGVDVFQRGSSFDPRIDTVVRVEARRLRSKLREYYETEGRHDALRIHIPKGSYVPFVNLSPDAEYEYFSDGLTEELINALVSVPGVRITSRTSSFAFKRRQLDIREIGEKLKVQMIVEGSVRKTAERLRITAQLINVPDDSHSWSGSYDREMKDVFELQDEIAQAIARALRPHLSSHSSA
jgi:TolB-like protein